MPKVLKLFMVKGRWSTGSAAEFGAHPPLDPDDGLHHTVLVDLHVSLRIAFGDWYLRLAAGPRFHTLIWERGLKGGRAPR